MLQGEYKHTLDAKSRLVAPSKMREELGSRFHITKGFDKCLYIFPEESWLKFVQKINALQMKKKTYEEILQRQLDDLNSDYAMLQMQGQELAVRNVKGQTQIKLAA